MTRAQQNQTFNTSSSQEQTNQETAQNAEAAQQNAINSDQEAISSFAAKNPYVQGGEFQTDTNKDIAQSADASSAAGKAALQSQAQRTGQNPAAANATAASLAEANERQAAGQNAQADQERIQGETGVNQAVLNAQGAIPGMEGQIANEAGGQSNSELSEQEQAAKQPGLWDTLGTDLMQGVGSFAGGVGSAVGKKL